MDAPSIRANALRSPARPATATDTRTFICAAKANAAASTRWAPSRLMVRSSRESAMRNHPMQVHGRTCPADEPAEAGRGDGSAIDCHGRPPDNRPDDAPMKTPPMVGRPSGAANHLLVIHDRGLAGVDKGRVAVGPGSEKTFARRQAEESGRMFADQRDEPFEFHHSVIYEVQQQRQHRLDPW